MSRKPYDLIFNMQNNNTIQVRDFRTRFNFTQSVVALLIFASVAVSKLPDLNLWVVLLGFIAFLFFIIYSIKNAFILNRQVLLLILFTMWSVGGVFVAQAPYLVLDRIKTLLMCSALSLLISSLTNGERVFRLFMTAFIVGSFVVILSAFFTGEYSVTTEMNEGRLAGFAADSNQFSVLLNYTILILLFFFEHVKGLLSKITVIIPVPFIAYLIVVSGSRAGFIGMLMIFALFYFLFYMKRSSHGLALTLVAGMGLLILVVFLFSFMENSYLAERFRTSIHSLEGDSRDHSTLHRLDYMFLGLKMTFESPIWGVGLNNFRLYTSTHQFAHNNYAEIFSTTGIVGGLIYYSIWFGLLRICVKIADKDSVVKIAIAYLLYKLFFAQIFSVDYYDKEVWILMGCFIGYLNCKYSAQRSRTTSYGV